MSKRGNEWTIYFRDGSSEPPAVHPGHDRRDYDGWQRMEVVRVDAHREAVEALRQIYDRYHLAGDGGAAKIAGDALRALGIDPGEDY